MFPLSQNLNTFTKMPFSLKIKFSTPQVHFSAKKNSRFSHQNTTGYQLFPFSCNFQIKHYKTKSPQDTPRATTSHSAYIALFVGFYKTESRFMVQCNRTFKNGKE